MGFSKSAKFMGPSGPYFNVLYLYNCQLTYGFSVLIRSSQIYHHSSVVGRLTTNIWSQKSCSTHAFTAICCIANYKVTMHWTVACSKQRTLHRNVLTTSENLQKWN